MVLILIYNIIQAYLLGSNVNFVEKKNTLSLVFSAGLKQTNPAMLDPNVNKSGTQEPK